MGGREDPLTVDDRTTADVLRVAPDDHPAPDIPVVIRYVAGDDGQPGPRPFDTSWPPMTRLIRFRELTRLR